MPAPPSPPLADTAETRAQAPKKMSMAVVNFWLDAALFLTVILVMWVSVMMQVVFPAPTAAGGWRLWGLSFNDWRNLQFAGLCICAALAIEHVVLHWNWVCSIIATRILRTRSRPDEGVQAVYGVGTLIAILVVVLASIVAALVCVKAPV